MFSGKSSGFMRVKLGNMQKELLMRLESSLTLWYEQQNTFAWTWLGSPQFPVYAEKQVCAVSTLY